MMFIRGVKLGVCAAVIPVAMLGSTVAQSGAVLLHQQNYNEVVSFTTDDANALRDFYVVANVPHWQHDSDILAVAPLATPSLNRSFSGSFIVGTVAPLRTGLSSHAAGIRETIATNGMRLYVGRTASADKSTHAKPGYSEVALPIVDSIFPTDNVVFVRFDINHWEVAESVVSYDIDVSYWGSPVQQPQKFAAIGS